MHRNASYLKWNGHIKLITSNLRRIIYTIKNLIDILEFKKLKVMYLILIKPIIINYTIALREGTHKTTID